MKRYGYLQALYMSFYSKGLYRDIANNWGAGCLLYLFLLLAITWSVVMFRVQPLINHATQSFLQDYRPQLPAYIAVNKGIVKTPENRPYLIQSPDKKETIAIIDTSGQYTNLDHSEAMVLVTKDSILYKDEHQDLQKQKISNNLNYVFSTQTLTDKALRFSSYSWLVLLPFALLLSYLYRIIQALVYALLGKIFCLFSRATVNYTTLLKITMIAITPAIIVNTILDCMNVFIPYQWALYFTLAMGYLIFGIQAVKSK